MKKILLSILLLTASTFIYSQSMDLNHKKIHIVDSTMGLGITPTSRLHVFGNGTTSNLFNVTNDKDATKDTIFVINAIGNVGIGKEIPTAKLYVQDTASSIGGSIPVAYIRAAKPNKIALGAVSISIVNEVIPDYNIGLYASSRGGTNNFAGYFNGGDVYINENLGIGTKTPAVALHIKDGIERLGVVTYSTLDSTHLSTQDVRCTDTIKTSGTFYYDNAGSILSINTAYGIKVYGFSTIDKDSLLIQDFGTTLSDNEAYSLPTNLSWKGEIDVDSLGYTLFTAQIRCDANGTPYLEGVSWKRWSSKTYVEVGSTDGYLNITDGGSGMVITNRLGYTIKATLRFRTKQ